jgi:hypothetical protein
VLSLSILQTNPAVAHLVSRCAEVGQVQFATVTCAHDHLAAFIHAISVVHHMFGTGVQAVSCLKSKNHTAYHLSYGDMPNRPEHGVIINCGIANFHFTEMFATAYGPEGAVQGLVLNDMNASAGSAVIIERIKDMLQSDTPDPLHHEMLMAVAVSDAAYQARDMGQTVSVAHVAASEDVLGM